MLSLRPAQKRVRSLLLAAAAAMLAVPAADAFAADKTPDLGMARLRDFKIQHENGKKLLRYTAIIVNVGQGPFEVVGTRSSTSSGMSVAQRIFDDTGGSRTIPTSASMYFAGDGHYHWHVRDLELGSLKRLPDHAKLRSAAKHGFCFYDNYGFGSTASALYTSTNSCVGGSSALQVKMGLSTGWGDAYWWNTVGQYVDVSGLPNGTYRLETVVNPNLGISQANSTNDLTWVDLRLKGDSVKIESYGPSA